MSASHALHAESGAGELPSLSLAILSRPGGREHNEDACGHWHSDAHLCCVVADGAGGHGGGDIASRLAVRHIIDRYAAEPLDEPAQVRALLFSANEAVLQHRADGGAQSDMHTTVVALFVDLGSCTALWGHAGDSRLYVFRRGQMLAHTRDHSTVQGLVEAGLLSPEQLRHHPQRSELVSALGVPSDTLQAATASRRWLLQEGDAFLLCTDGLWELVDEAEMSASLTRSRSPDDWLARLEQSVLDYASAAGRVRHDNFSGIALWVGQAMA